MLHWFADLMNVTEEVKIHKPNVSTLLSSAFIRGDLNKLVQAVVFHALYLQKEKLQFVFYHTRL